MRQILCVFFLLFIRLSIPAQDAKRSLLYNFVLDKQQHGASFVAEAIFDTSRGPLFSGNAIVSHYSRLSLNKQVVSSIYNDKPAGITLFIPVSEYRSYALVLAEEPLNSAADFSFGTITNSLNTKTSTDQGVHYRGYVAGDTTSIACVSLFKNGEVIGVFANGEGNFIIGKKKGSNSAYTVYKSSDMTIQPHYECASGDLTYPTPALDGQAKFMQRTSAPPPVLCKKVRIYWEADYRLYSYNFGSNLTDVQNYLTGLFNIMATLYQNEGIIVELSKTYVWTSPDPYRNANANQALNTFKARWNARGNNYDGDIAHLIAGGTTNNGGVAYVLDFDQCNRPYTYAYSNIYASFQAYPNYSWDAEVVTHETGHNLGSRHTHWCGWNTGPAHACGAIDNCAAFDFGSSCDSCFSTTDIKKLPGDFKGTIMSYCHLRNGIGTSLVNGFGPLPQAALRNNVTSANCFTTRNSWTGNINTAWENIGNWSCGSLPNANTDVVIKAGLPNYPVIKSAAICRSINEVKGTSVKIKSKFKLTVTGGTVN